MFSAVELWQAEGGCERVRGWVEELRAVKGFPHSNEWELVRGEICQSVRWPNAVCRKHLGARFRPFGVYLYPLWSVVVVKSACLSQRRLELRGGCGAREVSLVGFCWSFREG